MSWYKRCLICDRKKYILYKGGRSKHFIVCSLNEGCRKYAFNQANNVSWKRTEGESEHID